MKTKKMRSICIAPSWRGILPALFALLESKNNKARATAYDEFQRMAILADKYVEQQNKKNRGES